MDTAPVAQPAAASRSSASAVEVRIFEAARDCCERWRREKVTVDDIAAAAKVSRATIYRLFPGGKDVLFEGLRVHELEEFFGELERSVVGAGSLHELLVRTVVTATQHLREDQHLALALAAEPGEVLSQLTSEGVPRIVRFATAFLVPLLDPYLDRRQARVVIEVLSRLTISYFLAPSDLVDLGDTDSASAFLTPFIDVLTAPSAHPSATPAAIAEPAGIPAELTTALTPRGEPT